MKAIVKMFFFTVCLIVLSSSCQKTGIEPLVSNDEGLIKLGQKLENPYTVANMRQAYANLKSSGVEVPDLKIKTTHLYLRFLPATLEEFELIENEYDLHISDTPFDYEIEHDGFYYHDPSLPSDGFTWLYAAVERGTHLPDLKHELLAELFLPPTCDELLKSYEETWISFYDRLEHEALRITGNLDDELMLKSTKADRWRPKGYVKLWDHSRQDYIPIEHVKVTARRWFRVLEGVTNAEGYFECNGYFRRAAEYKIVWNRRHFSVNTNNLRHSPEPIFYLLTIGSKRTKVNGPKKIGDWNLYLEGFSISHFHGTIFKAAAEYYYGDISGLKRPPLNVKGEPKMRIIASLSKIIESSFDYDPYIKYHSIHDPDYASASNPRWIEIYYTYLYAHELYGLVIRNLAYASLYDMNKDDYRKRTAPMINSWGMGVDHYLSQKAFHGYKLQYARNSHTGIVEDMMDGFKTSWSNYHGVFTEFGYKEYEDRVSGYTITQIEQSLDGVTTIEDWLQNIKTLFDNETKDNLDQAFDYWFSL